VVVDPVAGNPDRNGSRRRRDRIGGAAGRLGMPGRVDPRGERAIRTVRRISRKSVARGWYRRLLPGSWPPAIAPAGPHLGESRDPRLRRPGELWPDDGGPADSPAERATVTAPACVVGPGGPPHRSGKPASGAARAKPILDENVLCMAEGGGRVARGWKKPGVNASEKKPGRDAAEPEKPGRTETGGIPNQAG